MTPQPKGKNMARKKLCDDCNLDGKCCCQSSQRKVDNCGMEGVLEDNKRYQGLLREGMLTQEGLKER